MSNIDESNISKYAKVSLQGTTSGLPGKGLQKDFPLAHGFAIAKSGVIIFSKTSAADERAYRTNNKKGSC